ncbi:MOSC domain-containing protein [Salaquimonas pukyongi]|uniref:MOSC domain-containing protein n=1 Tax=Salaquimonas pukyongi TaxID=2712698 RepID=UPI00096B70BA|nr:MOSC domain-containing protein [Salaquimonas pukyongi]
MIETHPPRKLKGTVTQVLRAEGNDFVSAKAGSLRLGFDGIDGDFHAGIARKSGGREPWYERGTVMRNERQISILSEEELVEIAQGMGIEKLSPGWIGANLVLEGIPQMSYLPPRTLLFFEGGVTLRVDGYNAPCRLAGSKVAEAVGAEPGPDGDYTRSDMALSFKDAARMKRGLVAWVEREGEITAGEEVTARIWEQWIYPG